MSILSNHTPECLVRAEVSCKIKDLESKEITNSKSFANKYGGQMSKENRDKKYKYLVTTRWYVETNEEFVAGAGETDEKILNLVQHRTNGKPSCKTCPTRSYEGYGILDYHYFMGDNKAVYMSTDKLKELSENNLS